MSAIDPRLEPWLRLAGELQAFDEFMYQTSPAFFEGRTMGRGKPLDAGATAANEMRSVIANRWTWYGWKQDRLAGIVRMELRTFFRWIAEEGGEGAYQATASGREMLQRIAHIDDQFKRLLGTDSAAR